MPPPPRVVLLTDARMAGHAAPGHPERPERLAAVESGVADGAAIAGAQLDRPRVEPATRGALERVHSPIYLERLEAAAHDGLGWIDMDTYIGPGSWEAARLAAGATIQAARSVASGDAAVAFAVVRPPGHHAGRQRAAGFCLVNNVAVAVGELRAAGLAQRIAILDWDVHHGDGTQAIYDEDPDLCYASTHQMPLYPGSGRADERGSAAGIGSKHNAPLSPGSGDEAFLRAWRETLLPAVTAFAPEAILASAGYDAHRLDPLAELGVTSDGFAALGAEVGRLARQLGLPGVALTLEGGYDLDALQESAAGTVIGILGGLAGTDRA